MLYKIFHTNPLLACDAHNFTEEPDSYRVVDSDLPFDINDIVSYDEQSGEWLLVNTIIPYIAEKSLISITHNGSISVKDLTGEDLENYKEARDILAHYYDDPMIFSAEDTARVLYLRKSMSDDEDEE